MLKCNSTDMSNQNDSNQQQKIQEINLTIEKILNQEFTVVRIGQIFLGQGDEENSLRAYYYYYADKSDDHLPGWQQGKLADPKAVGNDPVFRKSWRINDHEDVQELSYELVNVNKQTLTLKINQIDVQVLF